MTTSQTDILVIGGGPAGIEAATQCAQGGRRTLLVSATPLGGRATWGSLVPSKAWLAAAHARREAKIGEQLGLAPLDPRIDINVLRGRIQALAQDSAARYQARLAGAGVEIAQGKALLSGPGVALVTNGEDRRAVRFETAIVCSGSEPRFFPDVKPNGERLIAPRLAAKLPEVPPSILMVGAGVTGCEYAHAFATLGSRVTLITDVASLLPRADPVIAERLARDFAAQGIEIVTGARVTSARQEGDLARVALADGRILEAAYAFIAIGRTADLTLFEADCPRPETVPDGSIRVDAACRSSLPWLYAAGDATGMPMMANRALHQARIAAAHILGRPGPSAEARLIEAVYCDPQVAQIGDMGADDSVPARIVERPFANLLKANLRGETEGLLRVRIAERDGTILGAAAIGPYAADLLAPVQVAVNAGLPWERLSEVPLGHPTLTEILTQGW